MTIQLRYHATSTIIISKTLRHKKAILFNCLVHHMSEVEVFECELRVRIHLGPSFSFSEAKLWNHDFFSSKTASLAYFTCIPVHYCMPSIKMKQFLLIWIFFQGVVSLFQYQRYKTSSAIKMNVKKRCYYLLIKIALYHTMYIWDVL